MSTENEKTSLLDRFIEEHPEVASKSLDTTDSHQTPASLFRRIVALFIDVTIIWCFSFLPLKLELFEELKFGWIMGFAINFIYAGYFLSKLGATPGKLIMNIRVVRQDNGQFLSFVHAGFRESIARALLWPGYFFAIFNAKGLTLHDLIFKTKVIKIHH